MKKGWKALLSWIIGKTGINMYVADISLHFFLKKIILLTSFYWDWIWGDNSNLPYTVADFYQIRSLGSIVHESCKSLLFLGKLRAEEKRKSIEKPYTNTCKMMRFHLYKYSEV